MFWDSNIWPQYHTDLEPSCIANLGLKI